MANFVTTESCVGICAVGHEIFSALGKVIEDFRPIHTEKRTKDAPIILKTHACQTMQTRATNQIEEHRLHIVVGMMRHTDIISPYISFR